MADNRWLVDITTLNGVESNFRTGPKDLKAAELAGRLADFYAYASGAQFILPDPGRARAAGLRAPVVPLLVTALQVHDVRAFRPLEYSVEESRTLHPRYSEEARRNFLAWCRANPTRLRQWLRLHSEPWITGGHSVRVPDRYVYDVGGVWSDHEFIAAAKSVSVTRDDLAYAFDVALRYGYYGELAAGGVYLSHPIREEQTLPTMTVKPGKVPPMALSFGPSIARIADSLTLDQYASLLHEIRKIVVDRELTRLQPGAIETNEIRQIASDLDLPVRLRGWSKAAGVAGAVVSGIAAIPAGAAAGTLGAAAIALGSIFWDGTLPCQLGRVKWLRWSLHWDIEDPPQEPAR